MNRVFFRCKQCRYIYARGKKEADEKAYFHGQWQTSPEGASSTTELAPVFVDILRSRFNSPKVLDFGCGSGGLTRHLRDASIEAYGYDPYPIVKEGEDGWIFAAKESVQENSPYDVIISAEVIEHIEAPMAFMKEMNSMLTDAGLIIFTTALTNRSIPSLQLFPTWCYMQDLTHVGFFSEFTFEIIAGNLGLYPSFIGYNLIFLDKTDYYIITNNEAGSLVMAPNSARKVML